MPRIIQRFLLLLMVFLCASSALAETPVPWRDYTVREHEANRLVLEVQYANDQAERCVLTTGEGDRFPGVKRRSVLRLGRRKAGADPAVEQLPAGTDAGL